MFVEASSTQQLLQFQKNNHNAKQLKNPSKQENK
jgi:hypothetical protein